MDQVDDKHGLSVWRKGSGSSPHSTWVTHTPSPLAPDQRSLLWSVWHGHIMREKRTFRTILWSASGLNLSVYSLYSLVIASRNNIYGCHSNCDFPLFSPTFPCDRVSELSFIKALFKTHWCFLRKHHMENANVKVKGNDESQSFLMLLLHTKDLLK